MAGSRQEIRGEIAAHRGGDAREVGLRHAHEAEAERRSPMLFAADERELLDERLDRGLVRRQILDRAPKRPEAAAGLHLENFAVADATDGGEGLQRRSVRMRGARRIERETVAFAHPLERTGLAVIQLREAARDASGHVVLRDDSDPVAAFAHDALPCGTRAAQRRRGVHTITAADTRGDRTFG